MKSEAVATAETRTPPDGRLSSSTRDFWRRWRAPRPSPRLNPLRLWGGSLLLCAAILAAAICFDAIEPPLAARAGPFLHRFAEADTRLGLSGYIFALSAVLCLGALALRKRGRGAAADAALGLLAARCVYLIVVNAAAGLEAQALKHLVGRARPELMARFGVFHFDLFSIKAKFASFPSGHSVTAFVTATALGYFMPRLRIPLYLIAISVGVSRLILLAHYPSDVLAGAAIGVATAVATARIFARRRVAFRFDEGRLRPRGQGAILRAMRRLAASRA